jgi:CheY-like chemotaxis protein
LLDLIDEVLDIARIESGYLELTPTPVTVAEIVSEALELTNPIAARAEVVIRSLIDPRLEQVVAADRQRLMQVLLNLLSNAVKYNKPGGRVEVSCGPGPAGRLRLAVADTGRGIRPEDFHRVFVPFDRLGLEQTGIEGTGVGLALSQHLCERMGGQLTVESVSEVGSTFVVELPESDPSLPLTDRADRAESALEMATGDRVVAAPGEHTPAGTEESAPPSGESGTAPTSSSMGRDAGTAGTGAPAPSQVFRVLLVENNLTTLDLVERVLSRRPGTEVLAAMQGGLGVDLAREHVPDMILLDLYLPDMTGDVVLDRLAEDPATADVPVAVIGAEAPAQQVRQLLGRGVIGFLAKPIDVRGLLSLVDAVRAARGT